MGTSCVGDPALDEVADASGALSDTFFQPDFRLRPVFL
jgi:hypothetical protein